MIEIVSHVVHAVPAVQVDHHAAHAQAAQPAHHVKVLVQSPDSVLYALNNIHQFPPAHPHHHHAGPLFRHAHQAHQAHHTAVTVHVKFHVAQAITMTQPFHHHHQPHQPAFK